MGEVGSRGCMCDQSVFTYAMSCWVGNDDGAHMVLASL